MIVRRLSCSYWHPLVLLLSIAIGALASGCLWGVVKDADTGAPLRGVSVSYTDSSSQTRSTTTNSLGIYVFDSGTGTTAATGEVELTVDAAGYEPMTETRIVEYNDNPSSFWEVQDLSVDPPANRHHQEKGMYSITFPEEWNVMWETEGTWMAGVAPDSSPDSPAVCGALGGEDRGLGLGEIVLLALAIFKGGTNTDFPVLSPTDAQLDMADSKRMVISYKATIGSEEMSFKDLLYIVYRGNRYYVIDCSTLTSRYASLQDKFEEIAHTFRTD